MGTIRQELKEWALPKCCRPDIIYTNIKSKNPSPWIRADDNIVVWISCSFEFWFTIFPHIFYIISVHVLQGQKKIFIVDSINSTSSLFPPTNVDYGSILSYLILIGWDILQHACTVT